MHRCFHRAPSLGAMPTDQVTEHPHPHVPCFPWVPLVPMLSLGSLGSHAFPAFPGFPAFQCRRMVFCFRSNKLSMHTVSCSHIHVMCSSCYQGFPRFQKGSESLESSQCCELSTQCEPDGCNGFDNVWSQVSIEAMNSSSHLQCFLLLFFLSMQYSASRRLLIE